MFSRDFTSVTELPGARATRAQHDRLAQRYQVAGLHCYGKRVLEVGCGAGIGLGYLARHASLMIGGDYSPSLLRRAHQHYAGRIPLVHLDAETLPFSGGAFDTIVFLEGLYYLPHVGRFLTECRRTLTDTGTLVLGTVNREWPEFNPSPFSHRYHSARELAVALASHGFSVDLMGAFPAGQRSLAGIVVSLARRVATKLHLVPRSMKGKEWLKRLFYGVLKPLPSELSDDIGYLAIIPSERFIGQNNGPHTLVHLAPESGTSAFTILYAIGYLKGGEAR